MATASLQAVLEQAAEQLSADHGSSMAEIAAACGVSRATLHRHFSARADLVDAIVGRTAEELHAVFDELGALDDAHLLDRLVDRVLPLAHRYGFLALHPEVVTDERVQAIEHRLVGMIEAQQRAGILRSDVGADWAAEVLVALLTSAARQVRDGVLARRSAPDLVRTTLVHGLGCTS